MTSTNELLSTFDQAPNKKKKQSKVASLQKTLYRQADGMGLINDEGRHRHTDTHTLLSLHGCYRNGTSASLTVDTLRWSLLPNSCSILN